MPPDDHRCQYCGAPAHALVSRINEPTHLVCDRHYKEQRQLTRLERAGFADIQRERPLSREEMVAELLEIRDSTT